jgi:hypothetical protein
MILCVNVRKGLSRRVPILDVLRQVSIDQQGCMLIGGAIFVKVETSGKKALVMNVTKIL